MKITAFDQDYSASIGLGGTMLVSASGSNSGWTGGDVLGEPGDLAVVGLRSVVSLQSNLASGVSIGDVLTVVQTAGQVQARFATSSNAGSVGSNSLLRTTGGAGGVITVAAAGAAYTVMVGAANTWDLTLSADCTLALTGAAASGSESSILLILRQDGTGGRTVTWPVGLSWAAGSPPTLSTAPSATDFVMLETVDGGSTWYGFPVGGGGSATSPLSTKGDLWGYSTQDARFAVGSNGTALMADPGQPLGLRWSLKPLSGELLIADTPSGLPIAFSDLITNELGSDLAYGDM